MKQSVDKDNLGVDVPEHDAIEDDASSELPRSSSILDTRDAEPPSPSGRTSSSSYSILKNPSRADFGPSHALARIHTTASDDSPTHPAVSSPSSGLLKVDPNSNEDTPRKDKPDLSEETNDNVSTSWVKRVKSRLSFGFGTTVAPDQVMTFRGQAEAAAQYEN